MAGFKSIITDAGAEMLTKAFANGTIININSVKIGNLAATSGQAQLTNIISPLEINAHLSDKKFVEATGEFPSLLTVAVTVTNKGLAEAVYVREIGLFANNGAETILFAYGWLEGPDINNLMPVPINPGFEDTSVAHNIAFFITNQENAKITISFSPGTFLTWQQMVDYTAQNYTPIWHVGSTGNQHGLATTLVNGFMSASDKVILNNATNVNTPNTIVKRDTSGNFSAGTVSAVLSGNATTATTLQTARTIQTNLASTAAVSFNGSANVAPGVSGILPVANGGTGNGAGNAATATAWQTARTISLTGAITGSVSINGSANVSMATTATAATLGFTQSLAANGWTRLPNGLILQWGSGTFSSSYNTFFTITFPVVFPSACRNVAVSAYNTPIGSYTHPVIGTVATSSFQIAATNQIYSKPYFWSALGY